MLRTGIDRKYALVLLALAATLLGIGVVVRSTQPEPGRQVSEREVARLLRLSERRRLRDLSSYLSDAANSVGDSLVSIVPGQRSGVLWDANGYVITTGQNRGERQQIVLPDGRRLDAALLPVRPGSPVAVLKPAAPVKIPRMPPGTALELGNWVLAVARNKTGQIVFAHGLYQGTVEARCGPFPYRAVQSSVPLSIALIGGGVFTLDGELLGFVVDCEGRPVAISTASVMDLVRKPPSLNDQLEENYGFRVLAMSGHDGTATSGTVRVSAVWNDSIAGTAGLRPGDFLVGMGDRHLESAEDLAPLVSEFETDHMLQILRGTRSIAIRLAAAARQPRESGAATPQGIVLAPDSPAARVAVIQVAGGSEAAVAGVRVGDRILRIQGRAAPDSSSAFEALENASGSPLVLELERNGERLEVMVSP